jgi:ABC-type transport system involved in cytochrome c biogenesis permease subunit
MFSGLSEDTKTIIEIFALLIPPIFYIFGLLENRRGYYLFIIGLLLHFLAILWRGLYLERLPLTEKHDNISFMAFCMALIYLYFYKKKGLKDVGITALPLICLFIFISLGYRTLDTVTPFLRSLWFYVYMIFYFLGLAFFGISSCIGIHYVLNGKKDYEIMQYRSSIYGWVMLSIGLVAGSIWFFIAYGTYWLWTSKELWNTITWFYYGVYLHARYIKGLKGRPAAVMGILGFGVALFTYFGIGPGKVIQSPPTQF